jgi:hypothetical protein
MNSNVEWPSYRAGHSDHYLALGVIISLFNDLEFQLFGIFMRALGLRGTNAQRVFFALSNHERIDLIRRAMETEQDSDLKDLVSHFLDCFAIAADNRNLLAHSNLYGAESDSESAMFGKGSKREPSSIGYVKMTVDELRRVADEIHEVANYCGRIDLWFAAKHGAVLVGGQRLPPSLLPLPVKPLVPTRLTAAPRAT